MTLLLRIFIVFLWVLFLFRTMILTSRNLITSLSYSIKYFLTKNLWITVWFNVFCYFFRIFFTVISLSLLDLLTLIWIINFYLLSWNFSSLMLFLAFLNCMFLLFKIVKFITISTFFTVFKAFLLMVDLDFISMSITKFPLFYLKNLSCILSQLVTIKLLRFRCFFLL